MMEDYWVEVGPVYLDLNGRPVKRTLWSDPYSYDEFVIVGVQSISILPLL